MKITQAFLMIFLLAFNLSNANAENRDTSTTESKDAASAFMGTMNFVVGRLGKECLSIIGRTETPQEFVEVWQNRNTKYYSASIKYMTKRLDYALAFGGVKTRDAVYRDYSTAVRREGEGSVADWFRQGTKEEVCKRAIAVIDAGEMDVNPKISIYDELEALASWAEQN
jgi:hypothetical protein